MIDREILEFGNRIKEIDKRIKDIRGHVDKIETQMNDPNYIWKTLLPKVISEFDEFLKTKDYPIIGYENFFQKQVPITTEKERDAVHNAIERIKFQLEPYYNYWPIHFSDYKEYICRVKEREIAHLNEHLVYKLDNKRTWLYLYDQFYN